MTEIRTVGLVGAGLVGHGIAQVAAEAGFDVVLRDVEQGVGTVDELREHGRKAGMGFDDWSAGKAVPNAGPAR